MRVYIREIAGPVMYYNIFISAKHGLYIAYRKKRRNLLIRLAPTPLRPHSTMPARRSAIMHNASGTINYLHLMNWLRTLNVTQLSL